MHTNSFEYDLIFLDAGIDQLEYYLLSDDIYQILPIRAPGGHSPYPQLTLGWLLLFLLRSKIRAETDTQRSAIQRIAREIDLTKTKWRAAWGRKARAEFSARLDLWRAFLTDYRKNPESNIDRYEYEVNRRVLIELLQPEADTIPSAELDALRGLDLLLKAVLEEDEFIWDDDLRSSFPKSEYWFLYGRLKTNIG